MRGARKPPVPIIRIAAPARLPAAPSRDLRLALFQAAEKTRAALTAYRETPALEAAARVFDEDLPPEQQRAVAEEVVLTRAAELARAYPNTVAISWGPRRKRGDGGGHHRAEAPLCVRFLVGAKWPPSSRRVPKGTIPRRLLAMASVGGRRVLCAVPTDVEDARALDGIDGPAGGRGEPD